MTSAIRLVKGAYAEPDTVAFPRKSDVDRNYRRPASLLLENPVRTAVATHDEALIRQIQRAAQENTLDPSVYEFEMLYGIRRQLQTQLVQNGCRVRLLISYGSQWFPWYMRRLAERRANLWFVVKSLLESGGVRFASPA